MEKDMPHNTNQKKARIAILISVILGLNLKDIYQRKIELLRNDTEVNFPRIPQ